MKLHDIIQPVLSTDEFHMLQKAERIHEDPHIHTDPKSFRIIVRLMKLGLLRQIRGDVTTYEVTEKGKEILDNN